MKKEEINVKIAKLVDKNLESFMWNVDSEGNVRDLMLVFGNSKLYFTGLGDTFNIVLDEDE